MEDRREAFPYRDKESMRILGLIVNPIAGIGGNVALKGSDGEEIVREARRRGGESPAPRRAESFLKALKQHLGSSFTLITCKGDMGENEALKAGIYPDYIVSVGGALTSAEDTKAAALEMERREVDLIAFCGGDGTARDIMDAIDLRKPVIGVPSGVKMESAVFSVNPEAAALLAFKFLGGGLSTVDREVVDVDEEEYRKGFLKTRLYGYLRVPNDSDLLQAAKSPSPLTEDEMEAQKSIAKYMVEEMDEDILYIIGPGTTAKAVLRELGLDSCLLGVDVVLGRRLLASDVSERDLIHILEGYSGCNPVRIVVTPIGGQGYIFGRGNQQISPNVIRRVGRDNIIVLATFNKLFSLPKFRLLVDTGDREVDLSLSGYIRVIVDYRRELVVRVEPGFPTTH
ncbi:MAG: ATP-NAD kinase family protein [Candidatus Bathyarchaeia archaeon]